METKKCIACGNDRLLDRFTLVGSNKQYRSNKCRACVGKWNALPKEERERIQLHEKELIRTREEKVCPSCAICLPREAFYYQTGTSDNMSSYCRSCDDHRSQSYHNKVYTQHIDAGGLSITESRCIKCTEMKPIVNFTRDRRKVSGIDSMCKSCKSKQWKDNITDDRRVRYLFQRIRSKCAAAEIPFNLEVSDIVIPDKCPILGIPLRFGKSNKGYTSNAADGSPSVDRIDPTKGYTKGNIVVISWRANRIKGNATIDELRSIADFYSQYG